MTAADPGGPDPDLYRLLGVSREASREDITRAWRRQARAEHPDSRPADAAAPGRFRALAGAWYVLGDPERRAAYDQALARRQGQDPLPVSRPVEPPVARPTARVPGSPPLWAGPVRVEVPPAGPGPGRREVDVEVPPAMPGPDRREVDQIRLAMLAGLYLRCLARDWDWPW
jgi:hypothetical protein